LPFSCCSGWWWQQLGAVAVVAGWLALLTGLARQVRNHWPQHREWSRKLLHIGAGPVVLIAWWLNIDHRIAVPAAATVTLLAFLNHRWRILPAVEDVGRRSYGTVAYGATFTLLLLWFWPHRPAPVAAGVLVMAMGDGLAGLLGGLLPSPSWRVLGERRSLLGTTTMALVSLATLVMVASLAGPGAAPPFLALLAIALVATALEQIALLGLDNLGVPLAVAGRWHLLTPAG
jgi:phytol kinase